MSENVKKLVQDLEIKRDKALNDGNLTLKKMRGYNESNSALKALDNAKTIQQNGPEAQQPGRVHN